MLEKLPFLSRNREQVMEEQKEIKAENRQRDFVREQGFLEAASQDDQSYISTQESKTDLLRWQQDLDDDLKDTINQLLGYGQVNEGQKVKWVIVSEPLCNQKFITEVIIPHCKPFMTRNLINSNWSEKMILTRLKHTCNTVADAMSDGDDRYGIKFTNFDNVLNQIKTTIIAAAYRALNGWTKKTDSTMIKRIESSTEQQQFQPQQNKGIFGGVFKGAK